LTRIVVSAKPRSFESSKLLIGQSIVLTEEFSYMLNATAHRWPEAEPKAIRVQPIVRPTECDQIYLGKTLSLFDPPDLYDHAFPVVLVCIRDPKANLTGRFDEKRIWLELL